MGEQWKQKHGTREQHMKRFCVSINGNKNNFLDSCMSSFIHSRILKVRGAKRENKYLNAFATNIDFSNV